MSVAKLQQRKKQNAVAKFKYVNNVLLVSSTLLLFFGPHGNLFLFDEVSYYIFSNRNNCCEFLTFYGVITQNIIQSSSL